LLIIRNPEREREKYVYVQSRNEQTRRERRREDDDSSDGARFGRRKHKRVGPRESRENMRAYKIN